MRISTANLIADMEDKTKQAEDMSLRLTEVTRANVIFYQNVTEYKEKYHEIVNLKEKQTLHECNMASIAENIEPLNDSLSSLLAQQENFEAHIRDREAAKQDYISKKQDLIAKVQGIRSDLASENSTMAELKATLKVC